MILFSNYDVNELEQDIIKMFNVTELLEEFVRQYLDSEKIMSEDQVANYLDGISRVHNLQCERLWDGFDAMVRNRRFTTFAEFSIPTPSTKKGKKNESKTTVKKSGN